MLPPQVSCVVTEFTDLQETVSGRQQRHWGRFYLPTVSTTVLQADGTLTAGAQDTILQQSLDLYNEFSEGGLIPIVRTTNVGPNNLPVLAPVLELRVDDVLDIQRRRRYESVGRRVTGTLIVRPTPTNA
jgi:hypothetical protein